MSETVLYDSLATSTTEVPPPPKVAKGSLTELEARVLYTVLHSSWIPVVGHSAFKSAVVKLGILGGGFCCRDCPKLATHPHHLGGLVCDDHRPVKAP